MSFVSRYLEPSLIERLNHLQLSARNVVEGSITGQHRSHPVERGQRRVPAAPFLYARRRAAPTGLARAGANGSPVYQGIRRRNQPSLRADARLQRLNGLRRESRKQIRIRLRKLVAALTYLMLGQTEAVGLALCGGASNNGLPRDRERHSLPASSTFSNALFPRARPGLPPVCSRSPTGSASARC